MKRLWVIANGDTTQPPHNASPSAPGVDEFGFRIENETSVRVKWGSSASLRTPPSTSISIAYFNARENNRIRKWTEMMAEVESERRTLRTMKNLRSRTRKGVPDSLRSYAWRRHMMRKDSEIQTIDLENVDASVFEARSSSLKFDEISRDVCRTFPRHVLFSDEFSCGQSALRIILGAYMTLDPEVGYVQGMAFVAAVCYLYSSSLQRALNFFVRLMRTYDMRSMFVEGMAGCLEKLDVFDALLETNAPLVSSLFAKHGVHPTMYATQWFLTLFTSSFPFEFAVRCWDVFLLEGWSIVYKLSIAILQLSSKVMLEFNEFEDVMVYLKTIPTRHTFDDAMEYVRRHLDNLVVPKKTR